MIIIQQVAIKLIWSGIDLWSKSSAVDRCQSEVPRSNAVIPRSDFVTKVVRKSPGGLATAR
jgi:hypothetical protein